MRAGDPDSNDTDKIAPSTDEIVGIASGDFDADSMEAALNAAKSFQRGSRTINAFSVRQLRQLVYHVP